MRTVYKHVPNVLTTLRLFSAPLIAVVLLDGRYDWALAIFIAAGLSDALDGYLAKQFHLTSRLGRYLDPAADKTLMLCAFVSLTIVHDVPLWLTVVVVGRDLLIVFGALFSLAMRLPLVIRPLLIGKISTALQVGYIALHLTALAFRFDTSSFAFAADILVACVTIASGASYSILWVQAMRARTSPKQA